jgi:hypothetical protein
MQCQLCVMMEASFYSHSEPRNSSTVIIMYNANNKLKLVSVLKNIKNNIVLNEGEKLKLGVMQALL